MIYHFTEALHYHRFQHSCGFSKACRAMLISNTMLRISLDSLNSNMNCQSSRSCSVGRDTSLYSGLLLKKEQKNFGEVRERTEIFTKKGSFLAMECNRILKAQHKISVIQCYLCSNAFGLLFHFLHRTAFKFGYNFKSKKSIGMEIFPGRCKMPLMGAVLYLFMTSRLAGCKPFLLPSAFRGLREVLEPFHIIQCLTFSL